MPHTIPPFPVMEQWPRLLAGGDEAYGVERIHNQLRADVSLDRATLESLVSVAVQKCYDLLKRIHAERGGELTDHVLQESLPAQVFEIAIVCRWLPEWARIDSADWRSWIQQLCDGRSSRVRREERNRRGVVPYIFVAFPQSPPNTSASATPLLDDCGDSASHAVTPPAAQGYGGGRKRLAGTITSPLAARRMVAYTEAKGLTQSEFAKEVGTTDRTLRSFRKTGTIRRDLFKNIAGAMGTTTEALLKQE